MDVIAVDQKETSSDGSWEKGGQVCEKGADGLCFLNADSAIFRQEGCSPGGSSFAADVIA